MKPSSPTVAADPAPEVVGFDRTGVGFERLDDLVGLARITLLGEGVTRGRLDVVAVDPDEMADLNAEHMGHDGPTDVLSFPLDRVGDLDRVGGLDPDPGDLDADVEMLPLLLGDVVLCPDVARRQAPDHCGSEAAELALLVIHGVLHVLGHDHAEPDEATRMQARERHHLAALGFDHPEPVRRS